MAVLLLLFLLVGTEALAQSVSPRVAIVNLHAPVYPALANQARIVGDVEIKVVIRPNGQIDEDSIVVVTGHPMLVPTARESLVKSRYECVGCTQPFKYFVLFSFFPGPFLSQGCTSGTEDSALITKSREPQVSHFENHVTIVGPPQALCVCPGAPSRLKYRSARCLYLWNCRPHVVYQM